MKTLWSLMSSRAREQGHTNQVYDYEAGIQDWRDETADKH